MQHVLGNARVNIFYSDSARNIFKAVEDLGFGGHHELSQPGVPPTNAIAERAVQEVLSGTRTVLAQARLPGYVWSYDAPCYCILHNTRVLPHVHAVNTDDQESDDAVALALPIA